MLRVGETKSAAGWRTIARVQIRPGHTANDDVSFWSVVEMDPGDADVAWALEHYQDGIRRRDLWALSQDLSTPAKRRKAFVATLLWGVGTTNRYYGRHAEALRSEYLREILEQTVSEVSQDDLESAWWTAARLPGLGYRFLTKWLWVAGVNAKMHAPPLVFDRQTVAVFK